MDHPVEDATWMTTTLIMKSGKSFEELMTGAMNIFVALGA